MPRFVGFSCYPRDSESDTYINPKEVTHFVRVVNGGIEYTVVHFKNGEHICIDALIHNVAEALE